MKKLITYILNSASNPTLWGKTLDEFNSVFGITSSCMYSIHEFSENRWNVNWSKHLREQLTPELFELFESGSDTDDALGYQLLMQMPAQKVYTEMEVYNVSSVEELNHSDIRELSYEYGLNRRLVSALNQNGPWLDCFFFHSINDAEVNQFRSNPNLEIVFPIIANSVSLGRTLHALRTRYHSVLNVLDNLGLGVFLIDQSGCIITHNKEAQRIIDLKDGLFQSQDKKLKLCTSDKTAELYSLINSANGILSNIIEKPHSIMSTDRPSGKYDFLISARPLTDQYAELEPGFKSTFLIVIDPSRKEVLSSKGLAFLGELTEAETQIVDLLIQGLRLTEIADQRGVSIHTVKSQLENISQKLRCTSQNDIIRIAAATRVPIEN